MAVLEPKPLDEPIPPPDDASPEEKDLHWLRYSYQGDGEPQLTLRAVMIGGLLGMFMSISNLYTSLKLGWAFGVAITASVLSFVIWSSLVKLSGGRLKAMSILETNCMQSTASSAGYATGGTVGVAFAALMLIEGGHQPWQSLVPIVFLTAALGVFVAIPMKRQMINYERLPFPSGIAAAETLRSLYSRGREASSKARSLLIALASGGFVGFFRTAPVLAEQLALTGRPQPWLREFCSLVPIPEKMPLSGVFAPLGTGRLAGLAFEPSVLMIGAGMLIGARVAFSMLASSALLYYVLTPWLLYLDASHAGQADHVRSMTQNAAGIINPVRWSIWFGTAIMVFSSLASVALEWRTIARAFGSLKTTDPGSKGSAIDRVEVPFSWFVWGMIPITIGLSIVQLLAFKISIPLGLFAVLMSFVVSLVCCRATGETDTTPMGPMGKLTQLLYAALPGAAGNTTINLMAASTTCAAGASAADLLTDLKSGYQLGANARQQFLAQFVGVFFGTAAVVPAWYLMAPTVQALEKFPMPAAHMWKAVADLLTKGIHMLPFSALVAIAVGSLVGALLPVAAKLVPRWKPYLPSSMGLGLGLVVTFDNTLSFAVGASIAWLWAAASRNQAEGYTVPVASGLVAGESLVASLIAIACSLAGLVPAVR